MSAFVVDASVVVKWFVPEVHSDVAHRLLGHSHTYFAPDLLFAETSNTVSKKVRRGELTAKEGEQLIAAIGRSAVDAIPSRTLANDAYRLAVATDRTVYDCLYLALAVRLNTRMLTADTRFVAGLAQFSTLSEYVRLIQTFEG